MTRIQHGTRGVTTSNLHTVITVAQVVEKTDVQTLVQTVVPEYETVLDITLD